MHRMVPAELVAEAETAAKVRCVPCCSLRRSPLQSAAACGLPRVLVPWLSDERERLGWREHSRSQGRCSSQLRTVACPTRAGRTGGERR